jgi:hypothetical protein
LSPRWTLACFTGLLLIHVAGFANWSIGPFRTVSPITNYVVMLVIFLLPCALFALALKARQSAFRLAIYCIMAPWTVICAILAVGAAMDLQGVAVHGTDPGFEYLHSISLPKSRVAAYRTNGGATTSFGIVVRQETPILPGVYRVEEIFHAYPGFEADMTVVGENEVKISVPPYGSARQLVAQESVVRLRP